MRKFNLMQSQNSRVFGAMSSSLPILPNAMKESLPRPHNPQYIPTSRQLADDYIPLHHSALQSAPLHPRDGDIGSSFSSYCGSQNDSVSNHERQSIVASFISQSANVEVFQPLSDNALSTQAEAAWFPSSMDVLPGYIDNVDAPDNPIQSTSSAVASAEVANQNEWWAGIINDDWKDIFNATAIDSESEVCYFHT
jgi:hypothetical protein